MSKKIFLCSGFGLIEMIVAISISLIVSYGIISLTVMQNRENRSLAEKLSALELEATLISTLNNFATCSFTVNQSGPLSLDTSLLGTSIPPVFELQKVYAGVLTSSMVLAEVGVPISPFTQKLAPSSIRVENIIDSGLPDMYSAELHVHYNNDKRVRPIKPSRVRITLRTAGAGVVKTISGCTGGASTISGSFCNTWNEDPPGPNSAGCVSPDNGFCHIPNSESAAICVISGTDDDTMA
ncbi:MAG: type II secretion system protein [Bdellovibrionaceae bacterium]|nr:type II secretion system protein [Pseudobdellovibrionaceae bacterium]